MRKTRGRRWCAHFHSRSVFRNIAQQAGQPLPEVGRYAVGNCFLPTDPGALEKAQAFVEQILVEENLQHLLWRDVPCAPEVADVGPAAHDAMPKIIQLIVAAGDGMDEAAFARKLLVARKRFTNGLRLTATEPSLIYVCSLSPRVIVYKGMLTPSQLFPFYPDLTDPGYESHLAMVHSDSQRTRSPPGTERSPTAT